MPKLTRDEKELNLLFVDELFRDPNIYLRLYDEIIFFTYGKKKLKQLALQGKS
jgi:hypothetical protein